MTQELLKQTRNIYAVGRNYVAHAHELNNPVPQTPVLFCKSAGSLHQNGPLRFPNSLGSIHFELEIVLRIGIDLPFGSYKQQNCISHIGLGIDFTARDLQSRLKKESLPWQLAKNFNHACHVSKLKQGLDPAQTIHFQLWQNGQLRQKGDSSLMIFSPAFLLQFLNATQPLFEGDLLFTGTPEGVGPVAHGDQLRLLSAELGLDEELSVTFE